MPEPVSTAVSAATIAKVAAPIVGSIGASMIGANSAKKQQRFQERMSNTAHQREMKDLSKAGLNPLLTGKYGGSSTPQGTSFTPTNPTSQLPGDLATQVQLQQAQTMTNANSAKANAETEWIKQQTGRSASMTPLELDKLIQDTVTSQSSSALSNKQAKKVNAEIKKLGEELKRLHVTGKIYDTADRFLPKPQSIVDKIKALKSGTIDLFNMSKYNYENRNNPHFNKKPINSKGKK